MTYNLNIWRENQPENEQSFSRAFSSLIWSYGSDELKALGWKPFNMEGQWSTSDEGYDYLKVSPRLLLEWLKHIEQIAIRYPNAIPIYYQLWEKISKDAMHSTQLTFKCRDQSYVLTGDEFVFEIKPVKRQSFDLDLSEQLTVEELEKALKGTLPPDNIQNCLKGSKYVFEYAPLFVYFENELSELKELTLEAIQANDMLCHECS